MLNIAFVMRLIYLSQKVLIFGLKIKKSTILTKFLDFANIFFLTSWQSYHNIPKSINIL